MFNQITIINGDYIKGEIKRFGEVNEDITFHAFIDKIHQLYIPLDEYEIRAIADELYKVADWIKASNKSEI